MAQLLRFFITISEHCELESRPLLLEEASHVTYFPTSGRILKQCSEIRAALFSGFASAL